MMVINVRIGVGPSTKIRRLQRIYKSDKKKQNWFQKLKLIFLISSFKTSPKNLHVRFWVTRLRNSDSLFKKVIFLFNSTFLIYYFILVRYYSFFSRLIRKPFQVLAKSSSWFLWHSPLILIRLGSRNLVFLMQKMNLSFVENYNFYVAALSLDKFLSSPWKAGF